MKITKVETIRSEDRKYCWILIYTDTGYVGLGETYDRADPAEVVIHEFARGHLLGQNPEDIEKIWNRMYRSASFHGLMGAELRAMSGIDMGLWDLLGKTLDRPLYRYFGWENPFQSARLFQRYLRRDRYEPNGVSGLVKEVCGRRLEGV